MEDFNWDDAVQKLDKKLNGISYYTKNNYPYMKKRNNYENRVIFLANKLSLLYEHKIKIDKYVPLKPHIDSGYTDFLYPGDDFEHIIKYIYYIKNIYLKQNKLPEEQNTHTNLQNELQLISKKQSHYSLGLPIFIEKYGTLINDTINDLDSKIEKEFEEKAKKQAIIDSRITELQELIRKKHESIDKTISELTTNINTIDDAVKLFINKFDEVLINNQKMNEQLQQCMYNQAQLMKIVKMMFMFSKTQFGDIFTDEQMKSIEGFI